MTGSELREGEGAATARQYDVLGDLQMPLLARSSVTGSELRERAGRGGIQTA